MRIPGWRLAVATLLVAIAGTGCSTGGSDAAGGGDTTKVNATSNAGECGKDTRTVAHELGSTEIKGTPERVVALEFSFVDALASIKLKPVGIADDNDTNRIIPQLRDQLAGYTSVGLRQSPNLQQISALKPDLIIADVRRHKNIYDQLSQIAPTIAFNSNQASYQKNLDSAAAIGQALNRCKAMDDRLAQHRKTMEELKAKIPAGKNDKFMFAVAGEKTFTVHTAAGYTPSVLEALGLTCVVPASGDTTQPEMNLESFVAANPPILFVTNPAGTLFEQWQKNPLAQQVTAIKDNKVFPVDVAVWSRWRGVTAAELIAQDVVTKVYGG
ncbi:Fe(3+) dicitrate ABC transporter substrate-binding protein [Micromonospora yasonensis]|uniref:ABC transporter substrate-binding protein n=1 Tax=Micromonospora yasonensis TaxID=1128667 RepID=UPI00222E1DAF|nr:Fe(3+) dicitrate ABC transporter substrate-binding protein [Micromonospora yasonensis]MCW3844335.1 Fe(3+) dicitrate ABC transporter substrate-binding protein [Micromonospora yasonensis]